MKKKLLQDMMGLLLVMIIVFSSSIYSLAASIGEEIVQNDDMINRGQNQPSAIMVPQVDYYWKFTTSSAGTGTAGSWKLFYEGAPARKKGEIDTVTASVSYSHTFTGSIATEIKKKVQVQLGYSFGVSKSLSASRATKVLQKGQYVKAYYIKNYKLTRCAR